MVANIGILDASSDHQLGQLAAAGDLVPTTGAAPAPVTTVPATSTTTDPQAYVVDVAGTVTVESTGGALVARAVSANPGWTWTPGVSDATHVELTFSDGVRSLVFTATRAADGSIDARVDERPVGHGVGRDRSVLARRIRRPGRRPRARRTGRR